VDQEQPVSQQQEDEGPPSIAEMRDYFIPGNILLLFQHSGKEDVAKLVTPQMLARLFLGIVLEKNTTVWNLQLCQLDHTASSTRLRQIG
jgi:hypothetical protein